MLGLDQSVTSSLSRSVVVTGPISPESEHLLTEDALEFVATLVRRVRPAIASAYGNDARTCAGPAQFSSTARELHRVDPQIEVDGLPTSAGLFDFGLFVYHNADCLRARGTAPYFQLPKFEAPRDATLWTEAFVAAYETLELPRGSIRARMCRT